MSEHLRSKIPPEMYGKHFSTIQFKSNFGNCVIKSLEKRKWKRTQGFQDWNLQWCEKERVNEVFELGVSNHQRVNHFRLYTQLCRKDMLMKNIRKHKRQLAKEKKLIEDDWNFMPMTFFLPSEYIMFSEEFKKQGGLWIMKPVSRCQGSGIFIVDKLSQVAPFRFKKPMDKAESQATVQPTANFKSPTNKKQQVAARKLTNQKALPTKTQIKPKVSAKQEQVESEEQDLEDEKEEQEAEKQAETYIIQQYISKPLLFGNKKFDLRIYVLCTSYSNLTVWLYRNGFARFTHEPYNTENIDNLEGHLTNVEIQKHSENYDQVRGGKWLLDKFKIFLMSRYGTKKADSCFQQIQNIILKSLQAVQKNILVSKSSFELYGYDFMIDANLRPWLIEVNGGPSMSANTEFDCKLKCGLIDDVLTIVDLEGLLTGDEMSIGDFDLISSKGMLVKQSQCSEIKTSLGWLSDRKNSYKKLAEKVIRRKHHKSIQEKEKQIGNEKENKTSQETVVKKEKLLPNFYYKRRPLDAGDIDQTIRQFLKQEANALDHNQKIDRESMKYLGDESQECLQEQNNFIDKYFVPLKASKAPVNSQF